MRPNETVTTSSVVSPGVQPGVRFGIDTKDLSWVMRSMTNLYGDRRLAVVREYATNALDSHVEAGNTAPIQVTLPSSSDPFYTVRDFGVGLSVDEIQRVYGMYGSSTKRDSDEVSGMLGFGSKSGLTYALSFTVTAVKQGVRTIAVVEKDTDGVGTIRVLDTAATTDPNGVTVRIPVPASDYHTFCETARDFYRYIKPGLALVDGAEPSMLAESSADHLWLDPDVVVVRGMRSGSKVVMGNVAYDFTPASNVFGGNFATHGIIAWVPMGSVDFTPSRESLDRTEQTNETLNEVSKFVRQRFATSVAALAAQSGAAWQQSMLALRWGVSINGAISAGRRYGFDGDRTGWRLNMGWRDRASRMATCCAADFNNDSYVITGFPLKSLSAAAKDRVTAALAKEAAYRQGSAVYLLPAGFKAPFLDGRDRVKTWDWIIANSPEPERESRPKAVAKPKDAYTHYVAGTERTSVLDPAKPIVTVMRADFSGRWGGSAADAAYEFSTKHPEAQVVLLSANQTEKFNRLHTASTMPVYRDKRVKEILAAITPTDKLRATAAQGVLAMLLVASARIDDPAFALLQARRIVPFSDAALAAQRIGITIPQSNEYINLLAKYPLLSAVDAYTMQRNAEAFDDLIDYINRKVA